jgi:hypothetical protein
LKLKIIKDNKLYNQNLIYILDITILSKNIFEFKKNISIAINIHINNFDLNLVNTKMIKLSPNVNNNI